MSWLSSLWQSVSWRHFIILFIDFLMFQSTLECLAVVKKTMHDDKGISCSEEKMFELVMICTWYIAPLLPADFLNDYIPEYRSYLWIEVIFVSFIQELTTWVNLLLQQRDTALTTDLKKAICDGRTLPLLLDVMQSES